MRRIVLVIALVAVATGIAAVAAFPKGVSPAQLENAGWDCPVVLGAVHCAPPGGLGRVIAGTAETMSFLVFSTSNGEFIGTELIVRADMFNGQPCPTDPPSGQYTYLGPILSLDYWACHRYDSGF